MNDDLTFRTVLIISFLIVLPVGLYHRLRSQATREKLDRRKEGLFVLSTLRPAAALTVAGFIAYTHDPASMAWSSVPLPTSVRWVGVGVSAIAAALFVWTLRSLGRNLTDTVVTRKAHTLVTHGPYRWVRHPFYGSVFLYILANATAAANWALFAGGVLFFVLIVVRTRTEEAMLVARFGDAYRTYMGRTGRFLPNLRPGA